ncbi:hypothetical protein H8F11_13555 [Vibrio fluvialis]|uniref:hypothetical protein n=1 Tax=Vibrio fluvialis TaxID=676 RepID=UPI00192AD57C|nr:hypothetical protein [Vibrio fluvialis]MBL4266705.1 hypothetical protein [Vibrio fluvialis]MBL4270155.1 hypothetical protein [Vibrio fluvialis]
MMVCKLCGKDSKLIEAHIIPRSFYEPLKESGHTPILITDTAGVYPKRTPIGIYDREIVCESCEQLFSPWDDYALKFFTQEVDIDKTIYDQGQPVAHNLGSWDYFKLKMFFLSLLWRAAVTSHPFFKDVSLGPFESRLAELILTKNPSDNRYFAVALAKFDVEPRITGMKDVHRTRIDNVLHYSFYLFNYQVVIKVSSELGPKVFQNLYISPKKRCVLYCS